MPSANYDSECLCGKHTMEMSNVLDYFVISMASVEMNLLCLLRMGSRLPHPKPPC